MLDEELPPPEGQQATEDEAAGYRGPERRRRDVGPPRGQEDRRRRPGRIRRWIIRPVVWLLLLVIVVASVGLWYVYRPAFQRRLLERFVPRVSEYLGRDVRVGQLRYSLLPLWVELRDVRIGGPKPGDPPIATARRIYVQAELRRLRGPVLQLQTIEADGVEIWLHRLLDGSDNWPRPKQSGRASKRPWELDISSLTVTDAVFRYRDETVPLDLKAGGVHVAVLGAGGTDVQGRAEVQSVEVRLPHARPYRASVSGKVAVHRDGLEIVSARAVSPEATVGARGIVRWRGDRRVDLAINGSVAAELFQQLGYIDDQLDGWAQVDGSFGWRPGVWGWRGTAHASRLRALRWELTGLDAAIKGDRRGISADIERAQYGGGSVAGWVQVSLGEAVRRTRLELRLDGVDAEKFLDDSHIPVGDLASRLGGTVDYRFREADWRHGDGAGELRAVGDPKQGHGLALGGTLPFTLAGGTLTTGTVRLAGQGQTLTGSARYELPRDVGTIDYVDDSSDLAPLAVAIPVPAPPGGGRPLWLPTQGAGTLQGTLHLAPDHVVTELHLDLGNAVARGLTADRAQGDLVLSGNALEELHLELARGKAAAIVAGHIPFGPGPWNLALDVAGWPVEEARPWLPFELPVSGPFTGSVTLAGSGRSATGSLDGEVTPGHVEGLDVDRLRARLAWDDHALHVQQARIDIPAGEASAEGIVSLPGNQLQLTVATSGFDLGKAPFAALLDGVTGMLTFAGTLEGTLETPSLRGEAVGEQLALGDKKLGEDGRAALRVDWTGNHLQADGSVLGLAQIEGGGYLDRERGDLTFHVRADDLAQLRGFAPTEPELPQWSGHAAGELRIVGPLDAPELALRLDELALQVSDTALVPREPVRLRIAGGRLHFDSLYVATAEGANEVVVAGSIGLARTEPLDLRLQGEIDNAWIAPLLPHFTVSGKSDVLAAVRGTLDAPRLSGEATLEPGAQLGAEALPEPIKDLRATVLFYPDRLVIDHAEGTMAGGTLQATGTVEWARGDQPLSARLQVAARDVSLRYPEDWQLRGDGDLVWSLDGAEQSVRGVVTLDRALYLRDVDLSLVQLLQRFFHRQRQEVGSVDEDLAAIQLNLQVRAPGTVRIKNNLADIKGTADLSFRGSLARPVVFGTVVADPGSRLKYADNTYRVERATLTFANPYRIEPLLDLLATTRVSQYDVRMALFGNLERLNATFTSDPPLPEVEVLSLLLSGSPSSLADQMANLQNPSENPYGGAEALLLGQAASLVSQRVGSLFGFDAFKIQPQARSGETLSSARLSVGKHLSRDVYVSYTYDPSSTGGERVQVEWQVTRGVFVMLTQEQDRYSVDVLWEKRL